ncbi:MAG TPA: winged helix-turn-helix domain-containing protein [Dehalococcoidia bacterium]|nr:winged helix-turn-helix domain-containing protein [Dehalococcoidia bacterium]
MMPVIRVSDQVWEKLKAKAIPLEDTPNDVLRRIIALAEEHERCLSGGPRVKILGQNTKKSAPRGLKTSDEQYFLPILEALLELGGKADANEVLKAVERKMLNVLGEIDYQPLNTGEIRWRNTAQWARYKLVQRGLLKSDSQRGVWELTPDGVEAAKGKTNSIT